MSTVKPTAQIELVAQLRVGIVKLERKKGPWIRGKMKTEVSANQLEKSQLLKYNCKPTWAENVILQSGFTDKMVETICKGKHQAVSCNT